MIQSIRALDSQVLVLAAATSFPCLLCFGGGWATSLVFRSLIILVSIDQAIPIQNLPITYVLKRHYRQSLFLLVPNLLHDIRHAVEEATMHLQSEVVILVETAAILGFNEPVCPLHHFGNWNEETRMRCLSIYTHSMTHSTLLTKHPSHCPEWNQRNRTKRHFQLQ